jgi:reversibly glycosylated polypeptide/UDP-arabinopyranose mutase
MKDTILVVPSIREGSWLRFVDEWSAAGLFDEVDVILMEDNPKRTFKAEIPNCKVFHYDWNDIDSELGENSWIIPRRSDTVRSYGYLKAWQMRDQYKYVLTLDDDCYPPKESADGFYYRDGAKSFIEMHKQSLESRSKWFNTLTSVKPRGIPFYDTGKLDNVVINHGLWTNVLDYDAPTQLVNPIREKFSFDSRIVPHGQFFPMCGMNVMWKNEATVLMYHLLMGQKTVGSLLERLPFDRFGDIWCGIIAKKICDVKSLAITTGTPYIHHDRASNPFANLKKEANGLEVNEKFWRYVDKYPGVGQGFSLYEHYIEMGNHIYKYDEFPEYIPYFQKLGQAMIIWGGLLSERGAL